jgi:hypothetical protein
MNRLDLFAIAKETMKFTEDFMKETGCNECAEVEVYSPWRKGNLYPCHAFPD